MRHLMSPLDFSVEELDKLLDLANDIGLIQRNMHTSAMERSLQPVFMSQAQEPGLALRLPCLIWEARC